MNTTAHLLLLSLYAEWRRLTEIESSAINREEWPKVEEQQLLKQGLQNQIVRVSEQWHTEQTGPEPAHACFEREFRPIVTDLIEREYRNQGVLTERKNRLQPRLASAHQSASRLRGIQRAYGSDQCSRWQSYS